MLLFCPNCSNMLTISLAPNPTTTTPSSPSSTTDTSSAALTNRFICRSCPYAFPLAGKRWYERKQFPGKAADDVVAGGMGGAAQKHMSKARVQCPNGKCVGMEAAFYSVQIRSADEPMTNFYTCTTCGHAWRD